MMNYKYRKGIVHSNMRLSVFIFLLFSFDAAAQKISPQLVGTNVWYSDVRPMVWDLTKNAAVKTIRIGGHSYDKKMPSNETLLGWVRNIQAMGAEPVIQVSQYQNEQAAADLVRFFNVEKHEGIKPVKYWNIGNEPWLQAGKPDAATFATTVEAYFKPISVAMKAVDSTILIYGPNECDYLNYYNDLFGGKNDITGKVPGHTYYYCEGLTFHRYPQGNGYGAVEGANDMLVRIKKAKQKVDEVNKLHNRTGKYALQWGIGEYNAKGGPQVHTWGNGQMFGAVLGYCMEYGAMYANSWSMFEHAGDRKGSDFSFIDGKNMTPRASYRHMEFVTKYFTGTFVKGTASDSDFIVYAAKDTDQLSVMIMNRGFGETKNYRLNGINNSNAKSGINLSIAAKLHATYTDTIQQRSTQVLIFKGKTITKVNYTSDDFDNERPPVYTKVAANENEIKSVFNNYKGKPWNRQPQQIPGKVQCEFYDLGGEGIAYHDKDTMNSGSGNLNPANGTFLNEFRMKEAVDISYTKAMDIDNSPYNLVEPVKGELYAGWTKPGEWINYTVNVTKSGSYTIGIMYTASGDGSISLLIDGKEAIAEVMIPSTRNDRETIAWRQWHHWNRIDRLATIQLKKGIHVLTLKTVTNGNMNYDYLNFKLIK